MSLSPLLFALSLLSMTTIAFSFHWCFPFWEFSCDNGQCISSNDKCTKDLEKGCADLSHFRSCDYSDFDSLALFSSPVYPTPIKLKFGRIELHIKLLHDVRQLRFDFINFNLAPPRNNHCDDDILVIHNAGYYLGLCGSYNDRHLYYDVYDPEKTVIMSFRLGRGEELFPATWQIKISQLWPYQSVPKGCLQYYEGLTGTVPQIDFSVTGSEISNLNQRICIQEFEGTCNLYYEQCANFTQGAGKNIGKSNKTPILTFVPRKRNTEQVVLIDNFQSKCVTYQQDPCKFSNALNLDKFKPHV